MSADPRSHEIVHLDDGQLERMLAPLLKGRRIHEVTRADGGLVNTVYRVSVGDASWSVVVRVRPDRPSAIEEEQRLLQVLAGVVPVPEVLWADSRGAACGHPFMVCDWIDGETLNDYRRRASAQEWLALAEPLGCLLGTLASVAPDRVSGAGVAAPNALAARPVAVDLARARSALRDGQARSRLGAGMADRLDRLFEDTEASLRESDAHPVLVHGDVGGRNVLVRASGDRVRIAGLIDWESARTGASLWDTGSLFRYSRRFGKDARDAFVRGYRAAGRELADNWWIAARALDATRLVAILAADRRLPTVFDECRQLIGQLLEDHDAPAAV